MTHAELTEAPSLPEVPLPLGKLLFEADHETLGLKHGEVVGLVPGAVDVFHGDSKPGGQAADHAALAGPLDQ